MNIIKQIKENIGKKTVKNGAWLYSAQVFNMVCPMLSIPYITRILGAEKYGFFSIALNIITYLQVLVEYGFDMSATRELAKNDEKDNLDTLFSSVTVSRALLLIVSATICAGYAALIKENVEQRNCVLILSLTLLSTGMQLNWVFQGMQEMKYSALVTMVSRVASLIATFVFVKNAEDIYIYCFVYAVAPFVGNAISVIIARKRYSVQFVRVRVSDIKRELKTGWYTFTTQMSSKVFAGIGITFLGIFATAFETGIYSSIQKISYILTLIWAPIGQVLYPSMSQKYERSFQFGVSSVKKAMRLFLCFFFAIVICISILARPIVNIAFGEEYAPFYYWLYPQLVYVLLSILNNFLGVQILLASGHDREYAHCFYLGVVFNLFINFALIFQWKGLGASISPMCAEALLTVLLLRQILKIQKESNTP